MKILLISSIYPTKQHPDYGTFVKNVHELYLAGGHQVTLVAFRRIGGKLNKLKEILRFYKAINKALDHQTDFDLINLHYPYLAAWPVSRRLTSLRIPLLVSVHGSDVFYNSPSKRALRAQTGKILQECTRIIVPSAFFEEKIQKVFHISPDRIKIAPPGGFDGGIFHPIQSEQSLNCDEIQADQRESAGDEADSVHRIGFAGRLVEGKGWKILLEAFAKIANDPFVLNHRLVLAGSGPDEAAICAHAKTLGISPRVELIGAVKPIQLAKFYRSLEFFVFPTQFEESLGMVGIEALACGVPVIASQTGGVVGYMKDGVNGSLVPVGDVQALAQALLAMIRKSDGERMELSMAAIRSAQPYERRAVKDRLEEILREELP